MGGTLGRWVWQRRLWLVGLLLGLTVITAPRDAERLGDRLQVALPLVAWGCAAANGQAGEYALRFVAMWTATHGTKAALGDAPINIRPHGGGDGFPSAHTSASVFGASSLVHDCVTGNPWVQGAVILTAGYVGGSRMQAKAHDVWQVLFGALYGWLFERMLRRPGPARTAVQRGLRRIGAGLAVGWTRACALLGALGQRIRAAARGSDAGRNP